MIFVTVGTHEQPFDRIIKEIDRLRKKGAIEEETFIQSGYSHYQPENCKFSKFIGFFEMKEQIEKSRIVITHGGASSIMLVLYSGKIPLVVPRRKKYREHVDDHQYYFCRWLEKKERVIAVYEMEDMEEKIRHYDELSRKLIERKEGILFDREKVERLSEHMDRICRNLLQKG